MEDFSASIQPKFYFDESVELAVSLQLSAGGIDVVSAHSLNLLGQSDLNHLQRATQMERVLCTYDADFLRLANIEIEHCGIIFAHQQKASIGGWVREIRMIHSSLSSLELKNQVVYLSLH